MVIESLKHVTCKHNACMRSIPCSMVSCNICTPCTSCRAPRIRNRSCSFRCCACLAHGPLQTCEDIAWEVISPSVLCKRNVQQYRYIGTHHPSHIMSRPLPAHTPQQRLSHPLLARLQGAHLRQADLRPPPMWQVDLAHFLHTFMPCDDRCSFVSEDPKAEMGNKAMLFYCRRCRHRLITSVEGALDLQAPAGPLGLGATHLVSLRDAADIHRFPITVRVGKLEPLVLLE